MDTPLCVFLLAFLKTANGCLQQIPFVNGSLSESIMEAETALAWVSLCNRAASVLLFVCLHLDVYGKQHVLLLQSGVLLTDVCLQDGFRQKMKRRLFDSKTV